MSIFNKTSRTQQPNLTPAPVNNFIKSKVIPINLGAIAFAIIFIGVYMLFTKQSQPPAQNTVQTTPAVSAGFGSAKAEEQTASWIMYPNKAKDAVTYISRNPRYSFSYPPDWEFQSMSEGCGPVFGPSDGKYGFTICGPYLNTETPEILAKKARGEKSAISLSNIIVDNHRGIKQELEYTVNEENKNYRNIVSVYVADVQVVLIDALNGGQVQTTGTIGVSFEGNDKKLTEEERKKFDQILSTFKFTDQSQTPNMSSWKTYTSTQLQGNLLKAYSIKYPDAWNLKKETDSIEFHRLTLSRENYSITIYQAAFGGEGCIFEGEVQKYTQLESSIGILRRFEYDASSPNIVTFGFCVSNDGKNYGSATQVGTITYKTPKNYKQSLIDEMDNIVITLNVL